MFVLTHTTFPKKFSPTSSTHLEGVMLAEPTWGQPLCKSHRGGLAPRMLTGDPWNQLLFSWSLVLLPTLKQNDANFIIQLHSQSSSLWLSGMLELVINHGHY